jgi:hypothetical protein
MQSRQHCQSPLANAAVAVNVSKQNNVARYYCRAPVEVTDVRLVPTKEQCQQDAQQDDRDVSENGGNAKDSFESPFLLQLSLAMVSAEN